MSVYYYKLWKLLERKKIDSQSFFEELHIAAGTVQKLRKDLPVSMDTVERIRERLGCDFGDIITAKPDKNEVPKSWLEENVIYSSNLCRKVLQDYMEDHSLTVSDLMKGTSLSRNTIKEFLNGGIVTSRTLLRLYRLDGFLGRLTEALQAAGFTDDGFEHLKSLKMQGESAC